LIHEVGTDLELPEATVFGFGGGEPDWTQSFQKYVDEIRDELKLRYGGALVGDVNQVVHYGGIFGYPGLQDRSEGKLRLVYEGIPMANIIESMGGLSSDGNQSLLQRQPENLHERTPLFLGNKDLIKRLENHPNPS
jgi:fructose-1,6-bisphosphatase I